MKQAAAEEAAAEEAAEEAAEVVVLPARHPG